MSRVLRLSGCVIVLALRLGAQSLSYIYTETPKPRLLVGETVQLSATGVDSTGAPMTGVQFTWTSKDTAMATVDANGLVTATGLGIAEISVISGTATGTVRMQVVPQRIDVSPSGASLQVGDSLQFAATAYDLQGNPIPGVAFDWEVNGLDGNNTVAASITKSGLLRTTATGQFWVRAVIGYPAYLGLFSSHVFGWTQVTVNPKLDYTRTRLLSTVDVRTSFHLRPRRGSFAANDSGQIVFAGNLDGASNGLMYFDGGQLRLVLGAGQPGPVQNGVVHDFSDPAINAQGTVLARLDEYGAGSAILFGKAGNYSAPVADGLTLNAAVARCSGFRTTRYSLNNRDEFVFLADYFTDTGAQTTGIFRNLSSGPELDVALGDTLPGVGPATAFGSEFGLDDGGGIFFLAFGGSATGVFRRDPSGAVIGVLKTGDSISNLKISGINQVAVQPDGQLIVRGTSSQGNFLARYATGKLDTPASVVSGGFIMTIVSFQNGAAMLVGNPGGSGYGLYRFANTLQPVILQGGFAPNGDKVVDIAGAALLASGEVVANVSTVSTDMLFAKLGVGGKPLFSNGVAVNAPANLNPRVLVGGARSGNPHVTMGGQFASVFELDTHGLTPRLVLGDRFPSGVQYAGNFDTVKNPKGEVYVAGDASIHKLAGGVATLIAALPVVGGDGTSYGSPTLRAANDAGQIAAGVVAATGVRGLALFTGGKPQLVAQIGGTAIAGVAPLQDYSETVIDDSGRLMCQMTLNNGTTGYFLYSSGKWSLALASNATLLGTQVGAISNLRPGGKVFFALLTMTNGDQYVASYNGTSWTPVLSKGERGPNGNIVSNILEFDANRNGDVAAVLNLKGTGALVVKQPSGTQRLVHLMNAPMDSRGAVDPFTAWVRAFDSLSLMDDGRIFFSAFDFLDHLSFYEADPL